jgi:hypothetical protein
MERWSENFKEHPLILDEVFFKKNNIKKVQLIYEWIVKKFGGVGKDLFQICVDTYWVQLTNH